MLPKNQRANYDLSKVMLGQTQEAKLMQKELCNRFCMIFSIITIKTARALPI